MLPKELLPTGIIPNELLSAHYQYTAQEIDLLLRILTEIRMRAVQPWYCLQKKELAQLMNEGGSQYENLRKALIGLQKKPLEYWNKETGQLTICNVVSGAEFVPRSSQVKIYVMETIASWIKETSKNYTEFHCSALLKLRSKYSKLLYLKASQWLFTGVYICTVTDLRNLLGTGDKYKHLHNLRAKVLNIALDEINENTELSIVMRTLKRGKNIDVLEFSVTNALNVMDTSTDEKLLKALESTGLALWQAKNIVVTLPRDVITKKLYEFQCNRPHITNTGAYMYQVFSNLGVPLKSQLYQQLSIDGNQIAR